MPSELVHSNVVVVARQFNPSVFSQVWLIRNNIVDEQNFTEGCVFTDDAVKVETQQFGLLVIPPQLQFQPRDIPSDEEAGVVADRVGRIVRLLPHTPYVAIGLNFLWHVWPSDGDVHRLSRSLFLCGSGPFADVFGSSADSLYGGYFSKNTLNCRLRLDIKPISTTEDDIIVQKLNFAFNFQFDIRDEDSVTAIERHLTQWLHAKSEASQVVDLVEQHKGQ